MSADSQSSTTNALPSIRLATVLSDAEQQKANDLLALLHSDIQTPSHDADVNHQPIVIKRFVDGRGLACPMPLLKAKVGLRDVANGESLYVVATDANSQADITAFCRQSQQTNAQNQLVLTVNRDTNEQSTDDSLTQHFDTIYHFIITKTDSN
ncbi:sulfurtransferase TusA family protein [Psychrobacter alimentarius]|uniref:sulfurtransferase TusA family protein n=1 Tax=Psychrobacter alimentarius TaxID=261164 RepID=UPI00191B5705|nr:sulfurtransferase TusA family protein [Psychrobacter alimentarius]